MVPSLLPLLSASARRWVCCLLAMVLPAQAALLLMQRAHGVAHVHAAAPVAAKQAPSREVASGAVAPVERVMAALRKGHGSTRTAAPWFMARSLPPAQAGHGAHDHAHDSHERHHHAPGDLTVVPEDPVQDANGASTILSAFGIWAPPSRAGDLAVAQQPGAPKATIPGPWTSRDSALPDKPPKMA